MKSARLIYKRSKIRYKNKILRSQGEGAENRTPDQISATLKKALEMPGPVLVGVPVDYRDNHTLMEMVHPDALN